VKLYYSAAGVTLYHGDCRDGLDAARNANCVIADPPYGQTSLAWDKWSGEWLNKIPSNSLWCFGSLRLFMKHADDFSGWKLSQDIIWEKHNGSSFAADRFRRVHESAAHFYKGKWAAVYHRKVTTPDATARTVRTKTRPPHMGPIERTPYTTLDGGPRLMRSVIRVRSEHGRALHPTQKPLGILSPMIEYACPVGGLLYDPFCGVGSTLLAAKESGRRAVGVEIDERFCELAARRLDKAFLVEAAA
jgi:site-specific DNA-methyltransferase (adenine-specific)